MIFAVKLLCLFFVVLYGTVNVMKAYRGSFIPGFNFVIMSASVTGFVALQWLI